MFGILIYDILFFAIPIVMLTFLGISISRYLSAKKNNAQASETKKRKAVLIIAGVLAGAFVAVVIGFIVLMFMAVAFM